MICADGGTNIVVVGASGEFVHRYKKDGSHYYNRLAIPDEARTILTRLFDGWREADKKRIASQPLPCNCRIGSTEGGDTLSGIARIFYGDASKWPAIWEANKAAIKNPNVIERGKTITIPKPKLPPQPKP